MNPKKNLSFRESRCQLVAETASAGTGRRSESLEAPARGPGGRGLGSESGCRVSRMDPCHTGTRPAQLALGPPAGFRLPVAGDRPTLRDQRHCRSSAQGPRL